MIPAFIVLLVIACALGGYIAFDVRSGKRQAALAVRTAERPEAEQTAQSAAAELLQAAEEQEVALIAVEPTDAGARSGAAFTPSEVRESVTAQEVDSLMRDEVAATLVERSDALSDRTKTGIVNIDTLSECFESGEVVTLAAIKKRVKGYNKQTTYVKVLARGSLDKPLTVEADSFSLQAIKMILLTGGKAIKKR